MTSLCQPLPRNVAEEMLQMVARSICDRPTDTAARRESRTRQMIHSVMGFEPRDGLEYMLSTLTFGHYQMILDSIHDVLGGQTDAVKAKTKSTMVAMDRAMLEVIKEMRLIRLRPLAGGANETFREPEAAAPPPPEPDIAPAEPVAAAATPAESARSAAGMLLRETAAAVEQSAAAPGESADATLRGHMAEFEAAFAATIETLAEARALEAAKTAPDE